MNRHDFLKSAAITAAGSMLTAGRVVAENAEKPSDAPRRILGGTGLEVSPVGVGAGRIADETLLRYTLDQGVNFIDTSRSYQNGANEEMVGTVCKGRDDIVIMSKFGRRCIGDRKALDRSLDSSLRALQRDSLDILLIHGAQDVVQVRDPVTMEFFADAKANGKIRFCGFSCHQQHVKLTRTAVEDGFYDVLLVPYNHTGMFDHSVYGFHYEWDQTAMERLMEEGTEKGIGFIAMKTCSGGPRKVSGGGESYREALRWILRNPRVSTMTVAMGNFEEAVEDIGAMAS